MLRGNIFLQTIPLVISFKEQSYMLHPSFKDDVIFALQQDGTERFVFMIEENQSNFFHPKSLKRALPPILRNKERRSIEEKQQEKESCWKQQETKQKERREFPQIDQKRRRKEEEREEEILKSCN